MSDKKSYLFRPRGSQSEVTDFDVIVEIEEDVLRFEVPVYHTLRVDVYQSLQNLPVMKRAMLVRVILQLVNKVHLLPTLILMVT